MKTTTTPDLDAFFGPSTGIVIKKPGTFLTWVALRDGDIAVISVHDYERAVQLQVIVEKDGTVTNSKAPLKQIWPGGFTIYVDRATWLTSADVQVMLALMRTSASYLQGQMPDWAKMIWREALHLVGKHVLVNEGKPRYGEKAAGNAAGAPRPKPKATIWCDLVVEFGTLASAGRGLPHCQRYADEVFVENNTKILAYGIDVADLPALLKALQVKVGTTVQAHVMSNWE